MDELPRNASGKILKRELRDRFAQAVTRRPTAGDRTPATVDPGRMPDVPTARP